MLINSTISFFTAFGLEVLLFSDELWVRLPVGAVLAIMVLLIYWCAWVILEARIVFSLLGRVQALKSRLFNFTWD